MKKKVNQTKYDISFIKRVSKTSLEVSLCSSAKQRHRNVQKKCAASAKSLFCLLDLLLCFTFLKNAGLIMRRHCSEK